MVEEELATIGMLRPWLAMFVQPCRDVADIYTAGLHKNNLEKESIIKLNQAERETNMVFWGRRLRRGRPGR